ncbi:MAG: MBL fold metallo-hydrolase [Planctomycetota bacterium]
MKTGLKITRLGRSGFRLETECGVTLVDPPEWRQADLLLLTASELPEWIELVPPGTAVIGPPAFRSAARVRGVEALALDVGGEWHGEPARVRICDVVHRGDRGFGYLIQSAGTCVLHAGKTSPTHEVTWLADLYRIDGACLPIEGRQTMGPLEAAQVAAWLRVSWVLPWDPERSVPLETAEHELAGQLVQRTRADLVSIGVGKSFEWPPRSGRPERRS